MKTYVNRLTNYFDEGNNVGLIGHGETLEKSFEDAATAMFALMTPIEKIPPVEIITFDFIESDKKIAFMLLLNLLLKKAKEHHLVFSECRIKHDGYTWKVTAAGEKWHDNMDQFMVVKEVLPDKVSIENKDYRWEVRCVLDVNKN